MQINIYELLKWIKENKEKIDNAIIKKIYRTYRYGIILELFKSDLEKKYLYLIPGLCVFLSNQKKNLETDSFVMRLRKDFQGKKIKIDTLDYERAVVVSLLDNDKKIVVELFSEGNLIVVDKDDKILYAQRYKDYGIRKIFKGEIYLLPPQEFKIPKDFEEFRNLILNSNKKDIVRTLAIYLRLGKKYAEAFLKICNIDKNKKPQELSEEELKNLWKVYYNFVSNNKILFDQWYENVNTAFEKYYLRYLESEKLLKLEEERKKLERILEEQKRSLENLKKKINELQKIGEFLINYYWIFKDYNIKRIKEELESLGFKVKIEEKNNKIILEIYSA